MKDNSLRLRLVVRRHSLPEVRIIHHVPLENDPTIADLVDQINDIIPLESHEWGLEDYVVELRNKDGYAFECLHFQQVANVLKDEEEVFVRPLVTGDRKRRLLSGRDQISNDGRHLIDGVPFGRPRLRSPRDRPPVDIPPLKRRRIEYDTIERDDDEQAEPLFLTRHGEGSEDRESTRQVRFNNAGLDANEDEDEEEDDDFVDQEQYGDDEEEDEGQDEEDDYEINSDELADELEGLQETESREETPVEDNVEQPTDISPTKSQKSIDLSDIDRIAALRAAFPRVSVGVCEKLLLQHDSNENKVYWKLRRRNRPHMTLQQMLAYKRRLQVRGPEGAIEDELEAEASEKSDAESVASLVKHYDEHGFPAGSILDGSASRHMVEALRMSGQDVRLPVHKRFDEEEDDEGTVQPSKVAAPSDENEIPLDSDEEGSDFDLDEDDEDDEDLSEEGSDSSNDSDAVSLSDDAEEVLDEEDLREVSDKGSAASDSESGPEVYTTKVKPPAEMVAPKSPQPNDESSSSDESDSDSSSDDDSSSEEDTSSSESDSEDEEDDSSSDDSNSSDSDSSSRHNANANSDNDISSDSESDSSDSSDDDSDEEPVTSSSKHAKITKAVLQSNSEQSATLDTATLDTSNASNDQQNQSPVPPGQGKSKTRARNARRRLSARIRKTASRDTSILGSTSGQDTGTSTPADLEAKRMALLQSLGHLEYLGKPAEVEKPAAPVPETEKPGPSAEDDTTSAPAKRKTKLDVDAGRRMLFGSLGLKNPKSQEDEEQIRASLMKGVKPLVNHRVEDAKKDAEVAVTEVDPDAWRQKINYTAVECTEEGVELSEPPFPFYQRWDPQQQNYWGNGRGGPSKRKQQNQGGYEEEEPGTKKRKVSDAEENVVLNYDEEDPDAYAAQDHPEEEQDEEEYDEEEEHNDEQHGDEEEDLPPLPSDLTTLPLLQPGQAKAGMIITWKQFLLSKATNWQPQVMNMTGTVEEVWDQNDLRILLAKRDRNLDVNEKVYDDEGNRVYDKFEVPEDEDDADEDAEKGYRTINFADMMEPRVLRQSEDEVLVPETQHISPVNEDGASKASSRTLDHKAPSEPESQIVQESLIPATDHGSSYEPQAAQVTSPGNVSIDDHLRSEISLISTGSRPEADASVSRDELLNVSNPSPQREQAPELPSSPQHGLSAPPSEGHNTPPRSSVLGDELPDVLDHPSQEPESQDQRPPSRSSAYLESQRLTLNGFSDGLEQVADNRGSYVSYARLEVIPSDADSVRSGRQPDPEFSIDLGNNQILDQSEPEEEDDVPMPGRDYEEDVSMPGSNHEEDNEENDSEEDHDEGDQEEESQQTTPRPQKQASLSEEPASPALSDLSASSNDSFPSLSQTTTKSSQRKASQPPKSTPRDPIPTTSKTRKSLDAVNLDYEQAMKRLDEEESSQESTTMDDTQLKVEKRRQLSELAQKLAKTPIERPSPRKLPFRRTTSTPSKLNQTVTATTKSTRKTRFSGSFVIPDGSQVVDLCDLTSSPEPELNEDYADDDVDETYHESSPATSQSQNRAPPSTAPGASASFVTPRRKLFGSTRLSSTQVQSPRRSQPSIITGSLRKNRGSASSSK
ncbi:hypothetical protein GE21DRAFT_8495 [Neurospora crassa]|uniref:DUF7357 domain-containing protein n=1 Tax=Neurospora crassa (strain ATCC 24698 / 74-OR23-1A / CBS 708.71 / DSM 1257 / FGSC 987) TaxID=367110 RepID=V5ILS4_NEUCR|nr:hypothetical protein NCU07187 [Neurospora crassa OR74A]ESA42728.1 hypothetical protein NCU07187 [Neurospora crassa OR74A]KHE85782.1 hypothetical protein GE21DRAFT_8495 [Neurospora crassa]|eukprot:XP_011394718.1 hypothetical protein NCU07187 [Neurospora crassa OR74A]